MAISPDQGLRRAIAGAQEKNAAQTKTQKAALIGYARVSMPDQNLALPREAWTKAGRQRVFEGKVSGTRTDRSGLAKALEIPRVVATLVA